MRFREFGSDAVTQLGVPGDRENTGETAHQASIRRRAAAVTTSRPFVIPIYISSFYFHQCRYCSNSLTKSSLVAK